MDLTNALWITLIGMGLVFIAILMLWGLMALLVRLTAEPEPAAVEEPVAEEPAVAAEPAAAALEAVLQERKRRAAAAAVAYALAAHAAKNGRANRSAQPAGALSPWQAVNRAGRIGLQAASRKKVV